MKKVSDLLRPGEGENETKRKMNKLVLDLECGRDLYVTWG